VFAPLLEPARYKGAHGGRGSGKSHFFGEALVEKAMMQPGLRWVCIREIQKSLDQSVKRVVEDKIVKLRCSDYFEVQNNRILTPGGGVITFQGMQNHTADSIKSLEGYDGAWVEEAQSLSARSLRLLRPTLRKPGSELWFSWNPESAEAPVDQLLRGPAAVKNAIVVEANWRDNPWITPELIEEMEADRNRDPGEYEHIWEGAYLTRSDAVIFGKCTEIAAFEAPPGARFFIGVDWGFAKDPTVVIRCYIHGRRLYVDYEAFGVGVEFGELAQLFRSVPGTDIWPIKADGARPETISFMLGQGFNVSAAAKWAGSVEDGIAHLKGFEKVVIHERCVHLARESRLYSYKVDRLTEDVLPIIVDKHNHGWDALRYSLDGYITQGGAAGAWRRWQT
jgi:phage terminase large subunit